MPLLGINSENLSLPDIKYDSFITMPSYEFLWICKELNNISEIMNIKADQTSVKFSVKDGNITGSFTLKANDSDNPELQCKIDTSSNVNLNFSLRYLILFAKAGSVSQQVKIYLSKEFPLKLRFNLAEFGILKFYLAPRD